MAIRLRKQMYHKALDRSHDAPCAQVVVCVPYIGKEQLLIDIARAFSEKYVVFHSVRNGEIDIGSHNLVIW